MEVTPKIFERNLRAVCGTWTIDEYIAYLKTTNLSQKECKKLIKNFKEGEQMLKDMCEAECYGCSYDLLKCMSISSCRSIVENYNNLQGGAGNKIPLKRKNATSGSVVLVEEAKKKKDEQEKKAQEMIDKASGTFVTSKKKKKVKIHWKGQSCPICMEPFTVWKKENNEERVVRAHPNLEKGDELYNQAVAIVCKEKRASTSFIQRHLQIGYNRAARIIEKMENDGIISPANHVGRREVLVGKSS